MNPARRTALNHGTNRPYIGIVSTTGFVPQTLAPSSSYFSMTRKAHYTRGGITRIAAVWPGYYVAPNTNGNLGQELTSGNYTVSSWIEYPSGIYIQIDNALTVVGGTNTVGKFLQINIPAGAKFWFWSYYSGGTFPYYTNLNFVNSCMWTDEYCNIATSAVATTPSASPTDNQSRRAYAGPITLIGPRTGDCIALVGDSRQVGYGDLIDSSYDVGNCARSIGPIYDYMNLGCGGDRMGSYVFNKSLRSALVNSYATIVIDEFGVNDVDTLGLTVAGIQAYKARVQGAFIGKRYLTTTIEPVSTSTDSWATTANQTINTFSANRVAYNDAVRAGTLPYLELANPVEATLDSSKWVVNGTANYTTKDGLHATQAGSLLQSANANTFLATILTTPKTWSPQPNCNLTLHGSPTYDTSTQKFGTASLIVSSTVYAYCYGIFPTPVNTMECWFKTTA